jgi:hypothetical protein
MLPLALVLCVCLLCAAALRIVHEEQLGHVLEHAKLLHVYTHN